ncbi:MAG TPA: TlpA disulfide reductase family protein [Burkholderiaceae bacterium]
MKSNYLATGVIAILFTAIGLYFGNARALAETPSAAAAQDFFATSLPDAKNQSQALAQWKGKILLVNFWATWCHPCVQEMPELSNLQAKGKIKNLQIIGIGIDSASNIEEFSVKYKISYPLYVGGMGGSELLRKMGDPAGGLPFSLLIGADGQVKKTYLGSLKVDQVKRDIAAL